MIWLGICEENGKKEEYKIEIYKILIDEDNRHDRFEGGCQKSKE